MYVCVCVRVILKQLDILKNLCSLVMQFLHTVLLRFCKIFRFKNVFNINNNYEEKKSSKSSRVTNL